LTESHAPSRLVEAPAAYFLTFSCYGTRLHGDSRGTVDRYANAPGTAVLPTSGRREGFEKYLLKDYPITLDMNQQRLVLDAIRRHCEVREWLVYAAHVRTNHVHLVLWANVQPEDAMAQLKRYASRALNQSAGNRGRWWAHHGSTKYLWNETQIAEAVAYVAYQQGAPMALYLIGESDI
jgi:REP element-mobilizing transposase RayT